MNADFHNQSDASYEEAMHEERLIASLEEALSKSIRSIINSHFPDEIMHLSAEAYRELEKTVQKYACDAAIDICWVMNDEDLE